MNTPIHTVQAKDRLVISAFSAISTGVGVLANCRDAPKPMTTTGSGSAWNSQPTRIVPGASMSRRAIGGNPYNASRMRDTLTTTAGSGATQGNRTAAQTVLRPSSRGTRKSDYAIPDHNPAKRAKVVHTKGQEKEMAQEGKNSRYFLNSATGAGSSKGEGVAHLRGSTASDPETLSDSEDIGQVVGAIATPKVHRPDPATFSPGSPDPLDCFANNGPSSDGMKHPFDAPSKRGPDRRLAEDGESTVRLRARQTQRTTVPSEKEVLELPSSDIESFDDEDQVQRRTTPNGRSQIPKGAVKNKIQTFESGSTRGILDMQPVATTTPTIDLNGKRQSIKNSMKRKNAKQTSLAVFGQKTPLDVVATSSSGFSEPLKELVGKTKPLPLEAWSMGCALQGSQPGGEPVAWLTLHSTPRSKTVLLNVLEHPQDQRSPLRRFHLDRDFSAIKYSDPAQDWNENPTVVIQLQSTSSLKVSRPDKLFKAGDGHALGMVTFKFMTQHVNMFNEEDAGHGKYKALLDVLLREIRDGHETLRDIASKKCWEHVEMTAEYQQTAARIKTSSSRQSPASAGSSKHPTALDSERVSGSAPPSRTYGSSNTERRQTRQSTRSTRASPTPDLDELILVYPFSGTGAVNITRGDLKRLDPGQYLNDTIIEFGLKVWLDELRRDRPELAEQVHVFNSFFYKKLNAKKNVAETYASVRKWTSKVDIFSKKYIIVPINENFHWYLAIIENPKNMLHPAPPSIKVSAPQTRQTRKRKRESAATEVEAEPEPEAEAEAEAVPDGGKAKEPSEPPPTHLSGTMTVDGPESEGEVEVENLLHATQSCSIGEPEGDRDCGHDHAPEKKYPMSDDPMDVDASSALGTDDEIEKKPPDRESSEPITVDKLENGKETAAEPTTDAKEPTKGGSADDAEPAAPVAGAPEYPTCYIYTFDSLGSKHAPAGRHLGNYLRHEAVDKKKFPMEDTCMATYKAAKAPMQPNFCDCGVFVLAFVEAFMRNPEASSEAIRRTELSWWDDSQTDLRETFRDRTILLSEEWKKERAAKEGAKEDNIEDNTEEGGKARPNGKARPSPEIVPDSEEDEIEISAVHIPPKPVSRGGKKGSANVAARLRG